MLTIITPWKPYLIILLALILSWCGLHFYLPGLDNGIGQKYFPMHPRLKRTRCLSYWLLTLIAVVLLYVFFAWHPISSALLCIALVAAYHCDRKFGIIPDQLHILGGVSALGIASYQWRLMGTPEFLSLTAPGLGFVAGLWATTLLYRRQSGTVGLGTGDLKLLAWLSIIVGEKIIWVFALAVAFCLPKIFRSSMRDWQTPFAFVPALVYGLAGVLLWQVIWTSSL